MKTLMFNNDCFHITEIGKQDQGVSQLSSMGVISVLSFFRSNIKGLRVYSARIAPLEVETLANGGAMFSINKMSATLNRYQVLALCSMIANGTPNQLFVESAK